MSRFTHIHKLVARLRRTRQSYDDDHIDLLYHTEAALLQALHRHETDLTHLATTKVGHWLHTPAYKAASARANASRQALFMQVKAAKQAIRRFEPLIPAPMPRPQRVRTPATPPKRRPYGTGPLLPAAQRTSRARRPHHPTPRKPSQPEDDPAPHRTPKTASGRFFLVTAPKTAYKPPSSPPGAGFTSSVFRRLP